MIVILPSGGSPLEVSLWPTLLLPFVISWLVLICLGSFLYLKASANATELTNYSLLGFIFSLVVLIGFVFSVIALGDFGSFVGTLSIPSWQDWGPDVGFFLFFYSVMLSFVALIVQLHNRGIGKKVQQVFKVLQSKQSVCS